MDQAELFINKSRKLLVGDFLPKIRHCLALLTEDQIWWRPNAASNSIGNLVLHLEGNVRQWILSGVGGLPDQRVRQQEFDETGPIERDELLKRLTETMAAVDEVIGSLEKQTLMEEREIQGKPRNILEAVYHVVEHFSMHTGQIIMITKMITEKDAAFHSDLSKTPVPPLTAMSVKARD